VDQLTFTTVDKNTEQITFASAHGLVANQALIYEGTFNDTDPPASPANAEVGGLTPGATYYAVIVNSTTITLSSTPDGLTPVDITDNGSGPHAFLYSKM